jgi:hypothetical protein
MNFQRDADAILAGFLRMVLWGWIAGVDLCVLTVTL